MTLLKVVSERMRPLVVGVSVGALIAAGLLAATISEAQHRIHATQAVGVQAHILASTVTAALDFDDRAALRDYVGALRADGEVDAAGVYDAQGRLAAGFTRSVLQPDLADIPRLPDRVIATAPVTQNGRRLGTVYLRDRPEPLGARLGRYMAPGLLILMASLMFAVMSLDARSLRRANRALQNQIAQREKAEAALRQSQKMEAVGRLTGGIAHDFNNMLAIVIGGLDLVLRRYPDADPKLLRLTRDALSGADRAAALTRRLLAFSRMQPLRPVTADVNRAIGDLMTMLRGALGEGVAVETVMAGGLWRARIDVPQLESAIVNLAINARDAMDGGGRLTIETANAYLDRAYADQEPELTPGQYVMVAITDTGAGIPPELLGQVFEPFFTTKPPGMGTGLGLSQVHGFIRQSGGHMRIYSEVGVGTTVKLYLPRSKEEPDDARPVLSRADRSTGRGATVLVVEDEAGVRDFAVEALTELGFDVLSAEGAAPALDLLDANPGIDLLLTDVVMPQVNGRVLADKARARRPDLKVVFMTGYTRNAIVHNGMLDPDTHLVSKPFTVAQLAAELNAALAEERRR